MCGAQWSVSGVLFLSLAPWFSSCEVEDAHRAPVLVEIDSLGSGELEGAFGYSVKVQCEYEQGCPVWFEGGVSPRGSNDGLRLEGQLKRVSTMGPAL